MVDLQCCLSFTCTAKWLSYTIFFQIPLLYSFLQNIEFSSLGYTVKKKYPCFKWENDLRETLHWHCILFWWSDSIKSRCDYVLRAQPYAHHPFGIIGISPQQMYTHKYAAKYRLAFHQLSWVTLVKPTANAGLLLQVFVVVRLKIAMALRMVLGYSATSSWHWWL